VFTNAETDLISERCQRSALEDVIKYGLRGDVRRILEEVEVALAIESKLRM
jgi:hypothetical protein